jgi:hypothetical protein
MKTEIANIEADSFDTVPTNANDLIKGSILKFKDGFYFLGDSTEPLNGREVVPLDVAVAWVKWNDGRPEHRLTQRGSYHPERDELPDLDKAQWPNR